MKKILAIAPHTDDIELGCGATLHKFRNDYEIHAVAVSSAHPLTDDSPIQEFFNSMEKIGAHAKFLDFKCRTLNESRQQLLDIFYKMQKENYYDIVFCPSSLDHHQDHATVYNETFRAFKHSTILGYELPWNLRTFNTDVFITVDENDMDVKLNMLDCYKSQSSRTFMSKEYIYDIARIRGLQVGKKYAESFESIRIIDIL